MELPRIYLMAIKTSDINNDDYNLGSGFGYAMAEDGIMLITHLPIKTMLYPFRELNKQHDIYKKHYTNGYLLPELKDAPEDLELWNDLVKLNRSLEPKESFLIVNDRF